MDRIRNLPESPAETQPPLVFHILPDPKADAEAPIGPGDLEIEFEPDPEADEDDRFPR